MPQITLTGGKFQISLGAPLANGRLSLRLSHDARDPAANTQIASGAEISIPLDAMGNVYGLPMIWANDTLVPSGSFYKVLAFDSNGGRVWARAQILTVFSLPNPFDIGNLVPSS